MGGLCEETFGGIWRGVEKERYKWSGGGRGVEKGRERGAGGVEKERDRWGDSGRGVEKEREIWGGSVGGGGEKAREMDGSGRGGAGAQEMGWEWGVGVEKERERWGGNADGSEMGRVMVEENTKMRPTIDVSLTRTSRTKSDVTICGGGVNICFHRPERKVLVKTILPSVFSSDRRMPTFFLPTGRPRIWPPVGCLWYRTALFGHRCCGCK